MKFCTKFCLYVGIYFLSPTFVYSDIVKYRKLETTFEFKPIKCPMPSKDYSPKSPFVKCSPIDYPRYPKNAKEVQEIVKEAIKRGVPVKAFGNRLGNTDGLCTDGIPMSITGLQDMKMNKDNTATFGAGVNVHDSAEFLRNHCRAYRIVPAYGNSSLSGAIATGEHGSSLKYDSSISSQIVKMTIVNFKGELKVISNPEDLKAVSLSLGLLGIMVDVTFRTDKFYKTLAHNYISPDDVLTNGEAIKWAKTIDELSLHWFPGSKEVVVANRTHVDEEECGNAVSNDLLVSTYANFARILAKAKELAFSLTDSTCEAANSYGYTILNVIEYYMRYALVTLPPEVVPTYTEGGSVLKNPAVGFGNLMSSSICYAEEKGPKGVACADSHGEDSLTSLDSEFSIALCDLPAFVKAVKDVASKAPASFPLGGIRFTFSGESKILLSTAYGRPTVHVEIRQWNRRDIFESPSGSSAAYQTILQILTHNFNGRSHWGKSGLYYHNSDSLTSKLCSTARRKFIAAMKKYDPKELFINSMGKRLKGTGTKVDVNPKVVRCAIVDTCLCTKDADCGASQICTNLPGYKFRVCQTKNETADCNKSKFPKLSGVIKYLEQDIPSLAADALSKCK